ncbi:unnamed protein product [Prunus armeniaca]|uniref:Uncharacterized protein n=1 Tax=Prunus armeniaca TaxID=36596 RepID=A0A6J5W0D4_PRUAR|nr:unnamed protein product [Prunus armeniaca]
MLAWKTSQTIAPDQPWNQETKPHLHRSPPSSHYNRTHPYSLSSPPIASGLRSIYSSASSFSHSPPSSPSLPCSPGRKKDWGVGWVAGMEVGVGSCKSNGPEDDCQVWSCCICRAGEHYRKKDLDVTELTVEDEVMMDGCDDLD